MAGSGWRSNPAPRMSSQTLTRRIMLAATERYYERRLGIRTRNQIELAAVGVHDSEAVVCSPVPYAAFFRALKLVGARHETSTFIDYGCGLGRPVCGAALLPFKRVIGIELVPQIAARARENVGSARRHFRCQDVEIVTANAMEWQVPGDATVFHFYNPFVGRTLRSVLKEIARSMRETHRLAWIMSAEPWQIGGLMRMGKIIPRSWQTAEYAVNYPFFGDTSLRDPDANRYRVFVLDSRVDRIDVED